jgi:hypothetical protein
MSIDLEDHVGKEVEVEYRDSSLRRGWIDKVPGHHDGDPLWPYQFSHTSGIDTYMRSGLRHDGCESGIDIIRINVLTNAPISHTKIDIFSAGSESIKIMVEDGSTFVSKEGCSSEALVIRNKDLAIAIARAIIESHGQ